jgi:hypothetical protein
MNPWPPFSSSTAGRLLIVFLGVWKALPKGLHRDEEKFK